MYAPLAHRLGVQQVRWQLEDLAFATLHPKRYAEIEQMVAARAPQREEYLEKVLVHVRERLTEMGIEADVTGRPKHMWSIYEKMVVRGKEFDDINDLVAIRVVVGVGEGLLGGAGCHPRHLGAGARTLQGLHQHAQVQHVPVAAHDGHRAGGQAGRGADPHVGDAPPGRVRHRGALGLQVQGGPLLRDGVAAAHRGRRAADRRPDRVPGGPEARPRAGRGLRLHAQGQGDRAAGALDAGRLRLRHPHRGGAPLHRGPGQRAAGAAGDAALVGRHGGDHHVQGADGGAVAGLAPDRGVDAGPQQDPPVVLAGAARGRHRERSRGPERGRCGGKACRCTSCSGRRRCGRWPSR